MYVSAPYKLEETVRGKGGRQEKGTGKGRIDGIQYSMRGRKANAIEVGERQGKQC